MHYDFYTAYSFSSSYINISFNFTKNLNEFFYYLMTSLVFYGFDQLDGGFSTYDNISKHVQQCP